MATLFNLTKQISGSVGASTWIDLGLIPVGYKFRIGSWTCCGAKAISFNLYTNNATKLTGSTSTCTKLATLAPKAGASITQDLYKNGTLYTKTVISTGVEHWWINLVSKSNTLGTYNISISYYQE
jgi:hypothetical protein